MTTGEYRSEYPIIDRSEIGSAHWTRSVFEDRNIPAAAIGVCLAIASRIRWSVRETQIPVQAIAQRLEVEGDYVHAAVQYLCGLGYLEDTGNKVNRRRVYTPTLPHLQMHVSVLPAAVGSDNARTDTR